MPLSGGLLPVQSGIPLSLYWFGFCCGSLFSVLPSLSLSLFISLCLHHPSPKQLNHLLGPRRIILVFYSSSRDSLINLVLGLTLSAATLRKVLRHIRRGFWRRASSDASTPCTHTHHELSSRQEGECEQNLQLPQFVGKAISLIIQKVGEISGAEFAFPRISESTSEATNLLQQRHARWTSRQVLQWPGGPSVKLQ